MHLKSPVQWVKTMDYLKRHGITLAIEMGPKNVLSKLLKKHCENIKTMSFDHKEDRELLKDLLNSESGIKKPKANVITKCLAISTATPNYNFDNDEYSYNFV